MKLKYQTPDFGLTVDDIPYNPPNVADEKGPASRLTLHYFVDSSQLGVMIPTHAPHNSDARQPQDTSEWPPAVIVNHFYTAAAMKAWSPKHFIKYVRNLTSNSYYPKGEDEENDNVPYASGSRQVDVPMGDQTTGQSGSGRYNSCTRSNTLDIAAEERCLSDMMDCMLALWMLNSRMEKTEGDASESSLSRNKNIKEWLESIEDPETN